MLNATKIRVCLLVLLTCACAGPALADTRLPIHDGVGGDFSARSSHGGELRLSQLNDKVVLLFFGYTSCPDMCPANLGHLKALLKHVGPEADRVQVVMVTVDPENDTPEHLREYLASFDPGIIGLTGTPEEMARIRRMYLVRSEKSHGIEVTTKHNRHKSPVEQSYLYAHSQQIYLLDRQTRVRGLFFVGSPLEEMRDAILALLKEPVRAPDPRGDASVLGKTAHEHNEH